MDIKKEELFKLQVFQQTISTYYMLPLRIYKNNCYQNFLDEVEKNNHFKNLYTLLNVDSNLSIEKLITVLQQRIKEYPKSIDEESELYKLLESYADNLRETIWETHPSNSLTFTRNIKADRRIWLFLMLYDLFPKKFIDANFNKAYSTECLIDMKSIYVKLDEQYTLSIGRLFNENYNTRDIVKNIIKNYDFNNLNIFEMINLSKQRKISFRNLDKKVVKIKKAFQLFLESRNQFSDNIHKEELEKIGLFICFVTQDYQQDSYSLCTENFLLNFKNKKLNISNKKALKVDIEKSDEFEDLLENFERNRDYFRDEYVLRLKSTLTKKYTGLKNYDNFTPIKDLLKHITNRLSADGASFVKYNLSDDKLTLEAINGDIEYEKGIARIVQQINEKEPHTFKKSRVLNIIENYYKDDNKYEVENLVLKNLNANRILQPVKDRPILSNIAIPLTLQHKLLGVLLIDSFRTDNFTKDDMNLIFSISNFLSIQIFDQIVESNLSHIMENLPQKAELDDTSINCYFQNLSQEINNIFFSHGVSIWQYSYKEKQFDLKATTLSNSSINSTTIREDSNELIIKMIDNYNESDFDFLSEYNIKACSSLKSFNIVKFHPKINCLRIYPIIREGLLIGAFSVYNHSKTDYRAIDSQSLISVKKHLTIFFNTIEVIHAQRALTKTEALHEIHARFNMVENKIIQLKTLVLQDFKELDYYARYRFMIKLEDINNLIANTRISFNYISSRKKITKNINYVDDEIINLYEVLFNEKKEFNNVRHIFNELTNAIPYPYSCKNISINNTINTGISLEVHNLILIDIFQNLILNAVKYSFQGTTIRVFSKEKKHTISIFIKNDGLPIRKEEEIDIFKYGYRGFETKNYREQIDGKEVSYVEGDKENLGIGLYKSNQLVKKILTGEINLTKENSSLKGAEVNTFEVSFPKRLLEKGKNNE